MTGDIFPSVVNGYDNAKKTEQSQNKKNFAHGYRRRALIPRAAGSHAFIQFDRAPKNKNEWPPMSEHRDNAEAAVVVKEQQQSNEEQEKARKK
jgi:hypothetical protein